MEETRFLYSVNPRRVIKNLSEVPVVRTAKSLYLTKEDVAICIKHGPVYRRFANEKRNERVTTLNIDRLHNAKYMTEEEYKLFLAGELSADRGTVTEPAPEVVAPIVPDSVTPESEPTAVVTEPEIEEVEYNEETVELEEVVENEAVEAPVQEPVETEESVEEVSEDNSVEVSEEDKKQNNRDYYGKKKHR